MEGVTTLLTVVHKIVKAAETAHQNRARCEDLANRARAVGDILREDNDSATGAGGGGAYSAGSCTVRVRTRPLRRLKAALDKALELVESCHRRESGFGAWGVALITSDTTAAKFHDVETRITACVGDLGLAELVAARHRARRANTPPPQQQYHVQSAPPVKQSMPPLPPSIQRLLEQSARRRVKQSKQPLPPSIQRLLAQSGKGRRSHQSSAEL